MANNQTVKERLYQFIESQGMSIREFERTCGLSNSYVANIRTSIQPDKLQKIALHFPTLNRGWLMTGDGSMFNEVSQGSDSAIMVGENNNYHRTESRELIEIIKQRDKHIEELIEIIKKQTEKLTSK